MESEYSDRLLATVDIAAVDPTGPMAILRGVYAGLIAGNYECLREATTEDVEFTIHGFEAMAGTWRGRDEVIAATKRNFSRVGGQEPVVEQIVGSADCVAVLLQESGFLGNRDEAYTVRVAQWFKFLNGRIRSIEQIVTRIA